MQPGIKGAAGLHVLLGKYGHELRAECGLFILAQSTLLTSVENTAYRSKL